ncbi:NAD(P)H-dependent glycerol-3-phosphate dehydrogenase [Alkalilimnicola sp. S0819]|uniref:NAD(P)H-dependent glycerol-3-phosphate dehydrogenase n=1 Tax=Alkalilimnicola sp. S0819 TaxID=2613922 RepID=UPI00126171BC|nr:NAD(P)H-dependent glycerol-3-phosphate dehydrogenase [Alkalilimnicola sp. S0819]KAB7622725.1 NAD(P)-dependent glycerol-3-phosphate dehydrogenase [Alkalilimnicola sp. S0819]MPQ17365.1 NAD(P)H-dependent glycerol-3-phosphate dehydrogenase [Alkalilimnicola sp. S0819]
MGELAVLGAGSWGTALALVLARNGIRVRLWAHRPAQAAALARDGENRRYLPGTAFPDTLGVTDDLAAAVAGLRDILLVVPSHAFRATLRALRPHLSADCRIAWATKGLDAESGGLLHQVVAQELSPVPPMAVLSGPSFAREVAAGLPTAVTIAADQPDFARDLARAFHSEDFRPYTSTDLAGVELGGAVKNVLAIATGVSDGLGFGANSRAALITRGLAEVSRLAAHFQAETHTLMGLSGMGDLILTCTDDQSRNRRFGLALGRGESIEEALEAIGQTVEGLRTADEVRQLAAHTGVEMPICHATWRLLRGELGPREAVHALMERKIKPEF